MGTSQIQVRSVTTCTRVFGVHSVMAKYTLTYFASFWCHRMKEQRTKFSGAFLLLCVDAPDEIMCLITVYECT